ncbi:MAG TPA: hypothetical protein VG710_17180 [Opitutus sp.]|nr:hypothetical protein [Opitutus sp.]
MNGDQMERRRSAMAAEAKAIFNPERYAEYVQATDPRYATLNNIARRYELPRATVTQVESMQENYQQQAGVIRGDPKLSAEDRSAQLAALAREAGTKIGGVLGDSAFETYKQYSGFNYWFKPPPAPAK